MRGNTEQTWHRSSPGGVITQLGVRWVHLLAVVVLIACALAYAVRAYTRRSLERGPKGPSAVSAVNQNNRPSASSLFSRLRLQPEADKLRRRLGQRFSKSGLGVSVLVGTLTIGTRRDAVRITRVQEGDGERVAIAISSEPATLTWHSDEGTKAGSADAGRPQRLIVERLVLDSPDQFIYAQLRGAAYHKMARNVRPAEAGNSDDYEGPVWDMVRVIESTSRSNNKPASDWRIYYIDGSTGLIDKILSQEGGENVIAQVSSWVEQDGEILPARITWTKDKQVQMELSISNVSLSLR